MGMALDIRQYRVVGRVQGVGFRWFVRETARALGLAGWVRNESDGSVAVMAAGAPDTLAALEAALEAGPVGALVEHVGVQVLDERAIDVAELTRPFRVDRTMRDA